MFISRNRMYVIKKISDENTLIVKNKNLNESTNFILICYVRIYTTFVQILILA